MMVMMVGVLAVIEIEAMGQGLVAGNQRVVVDSRETGRNNAVITNCSNNWGRSCGCV